MLESAPLDTMRWPSQDEYVEIINLKRAAHDAKKNIKKGKIALIILGVLSLFGAMNPPLYVIPTLVYGWCIYNLKNKPKLSFEVSMVVYGLLALYNLSVSFRFLISNFAGLFALVFPAIFLFFLFLGYKAAKKYEDARQRLMDLEVDVSKV
jgi:hypothetical protein